MDAAGRPGTALVPLGVGAAGSEGGLRVEGPLDLHHAPGAQDGQDGQNGDPRTAHP
jgi:hypothetical protein